MDGDMSGEMKCEGRNGLQRTNVVIEEHGSASRVEVFEASKVVNLTINDHPLKRDEIQE
jgi:hypothetical protein